MRSAQCSRESKETQITAALNLDGSGAARIETGIGFFDHMLTALCVHAGMDLEITVRGDLHVDCHHTVEDTGIVLGDALMRALGERRGIARYASFTLPMDECLAMCALDLGGRPFLVFDCPFTHAMMGTMETAMVGEFFRALSTRAGITTHLRLLYGENDHHKAEALFKAFAHALRAAAALTGETGVLSTKGVLDL